MSFLDKVGLAFGVGTAKIEIRLDAPGGVISGGNVLHGAVQLQGGKLDQAGRLIACIQEHWTTSHYNASTKTTTEQHHFEHYDKTVLSAVLMLKAGELRAEEFPFALSVPWDGNLAHEWRVNVIFDVSGVAGIGDAGTIAKFTLAPPVPILGLVTALRAVAPFNLKNVSNNGSLYQIALLPTVRSKKDFDGLDLKVRVDWARDLVTGSLYINPQERTLKEHLQSILQLNNRSEPIRFSASALARGADPATSEPDRDILAQLRAFLYPQEQTKL